MRGAIDKADSSQYLRFPFLDSPKTRLAIASCARFLDCRPTALLSLLPRGWFAKSVHAATPWVTTCMSISLMLTRSSDRFPSTIEPKCSRAALMVVRRCTHTLGRRFR